MMKTTVKSIQDNRDALLRFSAITETDIYKIFGGELLPGCETVQVTLNRLKYDSAGPLWTKMIFRYRQSTSSASYFFNGCDPINRMRVLQHFQCSEITEIGTLLDFFLWLINFKHVPTGRNEFQHYFQLAEPAQIALVDEYNTWNERCKNIALVYF